MLSQEQRRRLLDVARASLRHSVGLGPEADIETDDRDLTRDSGAFVTLTRGGQLRGCIGYIEAREPLIETVRDMARAAALEDPRFPVVGASEEPGTRIEISVMSPVTPCEDLEKIEIGKHGLVVEKAPFRGLLLPQVPVEWGWDREEFLAHTCMKAGLEADAYKHGARVLWFEAEVFSEDDY